MYGDLMQEVLAKRYANTDIVKPINFFKFLDIEKQL